MANKPDWVQDPRNKNRMTYTDVDGSVYESISNETSEAPASGASWVQDKKNPNRYTYTDSDGSVYESISDKAAEKPQEIRKEPLAPEVAAETGSFGDEALRGLSMGTGAVVDGLGSAVGFLANPVNTLVNAVLPGDPLRTDVGQGWSEGLGLEQPRDGQERLLRDFEVGAASGIGLGGAAGAAKAGAGLAGGVADSFLGFMSDAPVLNTVAGGIGNLSAGVARESGAGEGAQMAAGLAGGLVGGVASMAALKRLGISEAVFDGMTPVQRESALQLDFNNQTKEMIRRGAGREELDAFAEKMGRPAFGPDLDAVLEARNTNRPWDVAAPFRKQSEEKAVKAATKANPDDVAGELAKAGHDPAILEKTPFTPMKDRADVKAQARVADIENRIGVLTDGWTNKPEFEIVNSVDDIVDDGIRQSAIDNGAKDGVLGFLGPDDKIRIISENIERPEDLHGVVYHEALGHYGLSQKFGDDLSSVLNDFYENGSGGFRESVDAWMAKNPDYYKGQDNPQLLAAEEVLAEMSERGAIPAPLKDKVSNLVKDFGRQAGLNLRYSDREIQTVLGMSHDAVIRGMGRDVTGNGFRFARVYHGSPHDFDEFDHSKMGSGEGAQVYGWGTYLTETKGVAEAYRDNLSRRHYGSEYDSSPTPAWQKEVAERHGLSDRGKQILKTAASGKNSIEYLGRTATTYQTRVSDLRAEIGALRQEASPLRRGGFFARRKAKAIEKKMEILNDKKIQAQDYRDSAYKLLDDFRGMKKGRFYEVDIPEDNWLLWDRPLKEQPEVQYALERSGYSFIDRADADNFYRRIDELSEEMIKARRDHGPGSEQYKSAKEAREDLNDRHLNGIRINDKTTAGDVYNQAALKYGSNPRDVSEALMSQGIRGNKYLDGMSRKNGEGSYNYVAFNEKDAPIVNKYMRRRQRPGDDQDNPSGPMMAGNVNLDRIQTARDVSDIVDTLAKSAPLEVKSWDQVKAEARDLNVNPSKISKDTKGVGNLSARLYAYRQVQADVLDRVAELAEKMDGNYNQADHANYLQKLSQLGVVHARVSNDVAEVARALNSMKIVSQSNKRAGEILEAFAKSGMPASSLADPDVFMRFMKSVQAMQNSGNPQGAAALMNKIVKPYFEDYVLSGRHSLMLSGLGTHLKNVRDNLNMIGREYIEAAAMVPTGGIAKEEMAGRTYGLIRAALDSTTYKDTYLAFKNGVGDQQLNTKTELESARIPGLSKVGDLLNAEDTFFRKFMETSNIYAVGVREARKQGFKGKQLFAQGAHLAQNATEEMLTEARNMADVALLVSEPSKLAKAIEAGKARKIDMTAGERTARFLAHLLFPFLRTTENLLFAKLRRSPLSFMDGRTRADFAAGGARRATAVSRTMLGSTIMGYYAFAADNEEVTGGEKPYKKEVALEPGGYRPNAVNTKDAYVDATALNTSFPNPFGLDNATATDVATLVNTYKGMIKAGEDKATAFGATVKAFVKVLGTASFAQNIQPYADVLSEQPGLTNKSAAAVGGLASQFVPALGRQMNNALIDTQKRDYTGDRGFADRVSGRVQSGIPGLSDNFPLRYDVYGEAVEKGANITGIDAKTMKPTDETVKEMQRLERTIPKPIITAAPRDVTVEGAKTKLTGENYSFFQKTVGENLRDTMKEIIRLPAYKAMTDKEKREVLREAQTEARKAAKEAILPRLNIEDFKDPAEDK